MDIDHPDVIEFITTPRHELPWVKRCVNLNHEKWEGTDKTTREAIIYGIKSGDIWLNKIKHDKSGKRISGNVCLEVYLPSRGTCLLQHINLSACRISDLQKAFAQGMSELCDLHGRTGVGGTGEYLPSETDRQVGLGMLGLANFLRINGVTYKELADALDLAGDAPTHKAQEIVHNLREAIEGAAYIARNNFMERAFAIAPTASCSYRSKDLEGYTATPEICLLYTSPSQRDS